MEASNHNQTGNNREACCMKEIYVPAWIFIINSALASHIY